MMYKYYAKIAGLHCSHRPELRIGQLMSNFEQWLRDKNIDVFYLDNYRFVSLLKEFLEGGAE